VYLCYMASTAVSSNAVSSVVGFLLKRGRFSSTTPNLPQSISILAEANAANQSGLDTNQVILTSAKQAGNEFGYGSPMYSIARILFNAGVKIPIYAYAQAEAGSAVAKVITVTPSGTATGSGTVFMKIAGREQLDGGSYAVNIVVGDTVTAICNKMRTALASVLGAPMLGSGSTTAVFTAKWKGLSSNDLNIDIDLNNTTTGVTFSVVNTTAGSGTPTVTTSLNLFGNEWNTIVINSYGLVDAVLDELEAFNGVPDDTNPTGRYQPTNWLPFLALSGSCADDPSTITVDRSTQVTVTVCPAPLSLGMPYEAAANMATLWANVSQNKPQGSVLNMRYPDMPAPALGDIPSMNAQTFREYAVNRGCSTAQFINGVYSIVDLVTTYNESGEYPPFYRWCRDLNIYFNYKFGFLLMIYNFVLGKTLVNNDDTVTADDVIKPKDVEGLIASYNIDCANRALIADLAFANDNITVAINGSNPNRLDIDNSIKISGTAHIVSATVSGGFNLG
jgi:phage tail sheath gpL-like